MMWMLLILLLLSNYHYYCLQSNGFCITRMLNETSGNPKAKMDEITAALAQRQ